MKLVIPVTILIAAFTIYKSVSKWAVTPSETSTPHTKLQSPVPANLRDIVSNRRSPANKKKAIVAMYEYLSSWDPKGHSLEELENLFGKPSVVRDDVVKYIFDFGFDGYAFQFTMQDRKVLSFQVSAY